MKSTHYVTQCRRCFRRLTSHTEWGDGQIDVVAEAIIELIIVVLDIHLAFRAGKKLRVKPRILLVGDASHRRLVYKHASNQYDLPPSE